METNRIAKGIREWEEKQQRLTNLFGASFSGHRDMERAKLDHYREVAEIRSLSKDERMVRRILNGEIRNMERRLYPSRFIRIVRMIGRVVVGTQRAEKPVKAVKIAAPLKITPEAVVVPPRLQPPRTRNHQPLLEKKRVRKHNGIKR